MFVLDNISISKELSALSWFHTVSCSSTPAVTAAVSQFHSSKCHWVIYHFRGAFPFCREGFLSLIEKIFFKRRERKTWGEREIFWTQGITGYVNEQIIKWKTLLEPTSQNAKCRHAIVLGSRIVVWFLFVCFFCKTEMFYAADTAVVQS